MAQRRGPSTTAGGGGPPPHACGTGRIGSHPNGRSIAGDGSVNHLAPLSVM